MGIDRLSGDDEVNARFKVEDDNDSSGADEVTIDKSESGKEQHINILGTHGGMWNSMSQRPLRYVEKPI